MKSSLIVVTDNKKNNVHLGIEVSVVWSVFGVVLLNLSMQTARPIGWLLECGAPSVQSSELGEDSVVRQERSLAQ